ncbi:hypothetical protein [Actinotignum sp. GS-2025b]|uniref:hypothetical protein n=1 Tax=Actinotignum sp. GS-2025b TaxID=3427275 RepID=UPI003F46EF0C
MTETKTIELTLNSDEITALAAVAEATEEDTESAIYGETSLFSRMALNCVSGHIRALATNRYVAARAVLKRTFDPSISFNAVLDAEPFAQMAACLVAACPEAPAPVTLQFSCDEKNVFDWRADWSINGVPQYKAGRCYTADEGEYPDMEPMFKDAALCRIAVGNPTIDPNIFGVLSRIRDVFFARKPSVGPIGWKITGQYHRQSPIVFYTDSECALIRAVAMPLTRVKLVGD